MKRNLNVEKKFKNRKKKRNSMQDKLSNSVTVILQWKHKEDAEYNWRFSSLKNIDRHIEELKEAGWKESEIKVTLE